MHVQMQTHEEYEHSANRTEMQQKPKAKSVQYKMIWQLCFAELQE